MKHILLKLIGYKHTYTEGRSYRFAWGEVSLWTKDIGLYWRGPEYCYEPMLILKAYFFNVYIRTPSFGVKTGGYDSKTVQWGFYLYPNLHDWQDSCFFFGRKDWRWYMPWTYAWESTEHLDQDLKTVIVKEEKSNRNWDKYYEESEKYKKNYARTYDYTYNLKNGEVQQRKASVTIERRTWHMRGWPWKKKIITSIHVAFDDEVGECTGSWKGGTIGCGYNLLPNETPEQCLRRMERERKFK